MNEIVVFLISFGVTLVVLFPLAFWAFKKITNRWIFNEKKSP